MSNITLEENSTKTCKCGRLYSHCHFCGSVNLYPMQKRSLNRTIELGRDITVYRCKKCGRETDDALECVAAPEGNSTDFRPYQKPEMQKPWGNLVPGSEEYLNLFCEEVYKVRDKKHVDVHEATATLIKAGWPLAVENMDEELKAYLKSKGLLTVAAEDAKEEPMRGAQDTQSPPSSSEASLEDIIKAMNEEQK